MRLSGVWGLAGSAVSPEDEGSLRAGAERGRGRLSGDGGRERGVNGLWGGENRGTGLTRAPRPTTHHASLRDVSPFSVSHCPSKNRPLLLARS